MQDETHSSSFFHLRISRISSIRDLEKKNTDHGYTIPQFYNIAKAYGIRTIQQIKIEMLSDILKDNQPAFIEFDLPEATYVSPKLGINKPLHDQEPPLPDKVVDEVINILR